MNRRHVLTLLGSAFLLSGCVSPETDGSNGPSTGQVNGDATESETHCTVSDSHSLPPADVPAELTKESAESVALSVEKSYAIQRAKAEGWNVDGTDGTDTSIEAIDGGFLVEATVQIDAHRLTEIGTETEEERLYGSFTYSGWYRVTEKRVERGPGDSAGAPPEHGWTTIACT